MKLPEAIEIGISLEKTLAPTMAASGTDALRLLIVAGEAIETYRRLGLIRPDQLLPGETLE